MIIRGTAITCLVVLLLSILYFPAVHPPEYFLEQVRLEYALNAEFWGQKQAMQVLDATLSAHADTAVDNVLPGGFMETSRSSPIEQPIERSFRDVSDRIRTNQYVSSIEALLVLATYRLLVLLHGLAIPLLFAAAAMVDGLVRRAVKAKQFQHHNPEVFAACTAAAVLVFGALALALVGPWTVHPLVWVCVPLLLGIFGRSAIANFHRRG